MNSRGLREVGAAPDSPVDPAIDKQQRPPNPNDEVLTLEVGTLNDHFLDAEGSRFTLSLPLKR